MKQVLPLLLTVLLCGCAGTHKRGVSYHDPYDAVRVDQMTGNNVSGAILQRTLLCLNARREARSPSPVTNVAVVFFTNVTVSFVTNQTVTMITNESRTLATNLVAAPPAPPAPEGQAQPAETNQVVALGAPSSATTNQSVTSANNLVLSKAPNQTVATVNNQTMLSRQVTTTTNNVSITASENLVLSSETNQVISALTNQTVIAVTNQAVAYKDAPVYDYYLAAELTPPPDFTLAPGDSLALLIDGERHVFAVSTPQAAAASRKGFSTYYYRVPPDVLVDIANAREVKVRLKGVSSTVEREMNRASRKHFRAFLLKYFTPETPPTEPQPLPESAALNPQPGA